jgi:hypothetical protein
MPTLQEVRSKFPQYNDMSDTDLAEGLHKKYYSDIPFGEFAGKIGYRRNWTDMPGQAGESAESNLYDIGAGLVEAVKHPVATAQGVGDIVDGGIGNALRYFGIDENAHGPKALDKTGLLTKEAQETITRQDQIADSVGRSLSDTVGTAEGFKHYVARSPVSAGLDVAGLLTGGATMLPKVASKTSQIGKVAALPMKQALRQSPSAEEMAVMTRKKFSDIKAKNTQLSPDEFIPARDELGEFIREEGITTSDAPRGLAQLNRLKEILPPHKQPEWSGNWYDSKPAPVADTRTIPLNELESVRRAAGRIEREASPLIPNSQTDAVVAGKVKKVIDSYYAKAADPALKGEIEVARELGRRNIIAKQIQEMLRKGEDGYVSGTESGTRNQFASYLRSSRGKGLTPEEKKAFKKVSRREGLAGALTTMGSGLGKIGLTGAGYATGGVPGAVGSLAAHGAARKLMEALTRKASDDAMKTVLMGRDAQKASSAATKSQRLKMIRDALLAFEAEQKLIGANQ